MIDRFGRTLDCLRISVTDRCNLRCEYCMPVEGVPLLPHASVLRFEEIVEVARAAAAIGFVRLRITGGEPLVRRGIDDLVCRLAKIPDIVDLAMTTNGALLADHAVSLARAGLNRVNVSLDAIRPDEYARLTRGGDVRLVFDGIGAAQRAGLQPIKLNCVVIASPDEPNARDVARFACEQGLAIRFIRRMDLAEGRFAVVDGGTGGDCPQCNRLRLSSDGLVRPCLFSNLAFNVRELGADEAIRRAVEAKPPAGSSCTDDHMHRIGG